MNSLRAFLTAQPPKLGTMLLEPFAPWIFRDLSSMAK